MSTFTFAPSLGWPVGGSLAAVMLILAVLCIVAYVRQRPSSDQTVIACIRRTCICVVLAGIALTPSTMAETTQRAINTTDVVIAVDTTGSMAVQDAQYGSSKKVSRLDAARDAVQDITAMYANSSFAAVRFAVTGTLDVPLTPDAPAIDNWADTLGLEPTSVSAGSSLDAPIDRLLLTLKSIRDQHPDDSIVLYLISDGEQTSSKARRSYSSLRAYVDDAFTVGAGSTQGGTIPYVADGASDQQSDQELVIDPDTGKPGISKLDEKNLTAIADELSGTYIHLDAQQTMQDGQSEQSSRKWRTVQTVKHRERAEPIVWPLALALTALLIWESGAWLMTSRRLI